MHRRTMLAAAGLVAAGTAARAQPLSAAQLALFETPHLSAIREATRLDYAFRREEEGRDPVEDRISLDVRPLAEGDRRDVGVEFLTGPRNLPYPPARGFRGNPLLLFALDRDARELAAATGGTMHWFRERIRRGFAEAAEGQGFELEFEGSRVPATRFELRPFGGEPRARRFQARRYAFVLADAVPGMVHSITSETPGGEGGGALREVILFRSATRIAEEVRQ
jgi:hypothetical protein